MASSFLTVPEVALAAQQGSSGFKNLTGDTLSTFSCITLGLLIALVSDET
jgi:hypothetical protein